MAAKIQVLMSTYNGEKYIRDQINSIVKQRDVDVHLLVRDDGSTDNTLHILEEYPDIEIIKSENVGSTKSFLELIQQCGEYDYYAFADQDDVWDEDKLCIAIKMLKVYREPAVYSSNTRLVDSNLRPLENVSHNPKISLGSVIIKNISAGCTMVMNRMLMERLKIFIPSYAPYHDWWVNVVTLSIGGSVIFDKHPHMSYRQHGENVVGATNSIIAKWKTRLNKFLNNSYHRDVFAEQVLIGFRDIIDDDKTQVLEMMANYKKQPMTLLKSKLFLTNSVLDNLAFAICVLLKKA